ILFFSPETPPSFSTMVGAVRAGAFAPALPATSAPKTQGVKMSLDAFASAIPAAAQTQLAELANSAIVLAGKTDDFGGYIGPISGLVAIGALILVLSPPLQD
ncbi:unnamed protein product, partial [Phaeothamnion confervicola]